MRGNGAASVTPASSSRHLSVTRHTGRNWLNAETVESREGVRCRPARSSTDVCQRGAVRQRIGGGNTPCGVSPHPQGARLALGLVRHGDGIHYPVGQPLLGDSIPFLLTSVTDQELLRASEAPGAVHVYPLCFITATYNEALLSGNMSEYKASCYALRRAVRAAKFRYSERIESHFQLNDSRRMWQGLRTICAFGNKSSAEVRADPLLADKLNTFYGRFECNGGSAALSSQ